MIKGPATRADVNRALSTPETTKTDATAPSQSFDPAAHRGCSQSTRRDRAAESVGVLELPGLFLDVAHQGQARHL